MSDEQQAIDALLGRGVIAYQRAFADIGGGAVAGLFLSQLYYWSDRGQRADGFIYKTQAEWQEETGLTRSQQETARRLLKQRGLIEEHKHSVPARLHYRINKAAVRLALSSLRESSKLVCDNPTNKNAENQQTIPETTSETTQRGSTTAAPPKTPDNDALLAWQHAGGGISGMIADELTALSSELEKNRLTLDPRFPGADIPGELWLVAIIKNAAKYTKQKINLAYVDAIVRSWIANGYEPKRKRASNGGALKESFDEIDAWANGGATT